MKKVYLLYFCTILFSIYKVQAEISMPLNNDTIIFTNLKSFGAKGDGITDDTKAFKTAFAFCNAHKRTLYIPPGTYKISETIIKSESFYCPSIVGENNASILDYSALTNKPLFKIIGGSGDLAQTRITDLVFQGNTTTTGIEITGQCGVIIYNCYFRENKIGVLFHNELKGQFTEYNVIENSAFSSDCTVAYEYKRSNGNESFNGSGCKSIKVNTNNDYAIKIGKNCMVYNAPLDGQFWTNKSNQKIINNQGSERCNTYGTLTIENFVSGVQIIDSLDIPLFHAGNIIGAGKFYVGNLIECNNINISGPENSNIRSYGLKPRIITKKLNQGENLIAPMPSMYSSFLGESIFANVIISGNNYEDRVLLSLNHNGYGKNGSVTIVAQHFQINNTTIKGFPTYRLDSLGNLIIVMPIFLNKTINAVVCFMPLSSGLSAN